MAELPIVGVGTDVHPFENGRELHLGGVPWPGERGLSGHSDGDVAAHAICDAILSAAGLGDLGANFGTSDPQWAGAAGTALLSESAKRVREAGYTIGNASVQIICEQPKIGARRTQMEAVLTDALGASVRVSGTTTDQLGFTGRGEGIAAVAVALIAHR